MKDSSRTNQELLKENYLLHPRINELKQSESDHKHSNESLKQSDDKFRPLAESSHEYIMCYNRQCEYTYMNLAALNISGLTGLDTVANPEEVSLKNKLWLCFLAFLICFCVFFFYYAYDDAKQTAIADLNEKQMSYARQASIGIENFFKQWTNLLISITRVNAIADLDETGKKYISFTYKRGISLATPKQ
jgi:hypothetical protein